MPARTPKRVTILDLGRGGQSSVVVGVYTPPPVEGDDDELMPVTRISQNTELSASTGGTYIAQSSSQQITVTLPALSAVPADGVRYLIKREGTNSVIINRAGSDTYEDGSTSKTLYQDYAAISIGADTSANDWYIWGRYGAVT